MRMLLLIGLFHVIGDFYLQPEKLVVAKATKRRGLVIHAFIYAMAMGVVFLCSPWYYALPAWCGLSVTHWIIDALRLCIDRKQDKPFVKVASFCIDQLLHLLIVATCWLLFLRKEQTNTFAYLCSFPWFKTVLVYLAAGSIITKPSSVLVKKVFKVFPQIEEETNDKMKSIAKAGELIGCLERIIIITLVFCGATTAIGFVMTAKSIARFKQLENKSFVERYLIGTLLSVSLALITALIASKIA